MKINAVMNSLRALPDKWQGFLLNPRARRTGSDINWEGFADPTIADVMFAEDVIALAEQKQYSYQIRDGSLLQFLYSFDGNGGQLSAASLAFIQAPGEESASDEDDELDEGDLECADLDPVAQPLQIPTAWVRIDYAPSESRGCVHGACHMHLSLSPNVRMPVIGLPSPEQFVEAIVAWFYPREYRERLLNDVGQFKSIDRIIEVNREAMDVVIDKESLQILHLNVPNSRYGGELRNAMANREL